MYQVLRQATSLNPREPREPSITFSQVYRQSTGVLGGLFMGAASWASQPAVFPRGFQLPQTWSTCHPSCAPRATAQHSILGPRLLELIFFAPMPSCLSS